MQDFMKKIPLVSLTVRHVTANFNYLFRNETPTAVFNEASLLAFSAKCTTSSGITARLRRHLFSRGVHEILAHPYTLHTPLNARKNFAGMHRMDGEKQSRVDLYSCQFADARKLTVELRIDLFDRIKDSEFLEYIILARSISLH